MPRLRSDSTLAQLNEDQLADLYSWIDELSLDEAGAMAAKSSPEGFGLRIHRTTLQRFYRDEQKRRHLEHLAELAAQTNALDNNVIEAESAELAKLMAAARAGFVHATFELAKAADNPKNYEVLERAFHHRDLVRLKTEELKLKQQELALARERLAETKRQFNFNAARAALNHAARFKELLTNARRKASKFVESTAGNSNSSDVGLFARINQLAY